VRPAEGASKIDRPTETINLVNRLTKLAEGRDDTATEARRHAEESFLRDHVFRGFKELKQPYDSPLIAHFSVVDFLRVTARCNLLGVHINGLEIFNPLGLLIEVEIGERGLQRLVCPSDAAIFVGQTIVLRDVFSVGPRAQHAT
jgi:hypothetical protein